ncbi:hypothetical protein P280DRAFT_473121 [Massarina eburnea CBS 473.64]|uniref:Wax synthase domain-containing protein n=1 Tax=Massarina eburnea CBS 473.64 TaxID=1395130 RepID=A0A6A6RLN9_9PLEO|nr:hypothetical protein P280DRAFT_473121 [Massarina eburnea CBS 473.64]
MSILFAAAYGAWKTSNNLSPDDTFNEIYTRYILIGSSHILSMAYQNDGRKDVPNHLDHKDARADWNPWYRGWKNLFNIRGVGTPWENPFLWPGIKYTWEAPKPTNTESVTISNKKEEDKPRTRHNLTTKGRWTGVGIRLIYIAINFVLLAAYYEFMTEDHLSQTFPSDYTREKEGILRRLFWSYVGNKPPATSVTFREIQIRAREAFDAIVGDYFLLSLYHDCCAVVFIIIGLDESWEWPPFFGVISQVWSIRRFWNMFWHRVIYRSFSSHASIISRALGIRQNSQLARYVNAFLVFGLSAVMHSLISAKFGNRCAWGRTMAYWTMQPVAFILEHVVQSVWHATLRRSVRRLLGNNGLLNVCERLVGYVWVVVWLLWEAPKRTFPLMSCEA